jgi:hypothetical protein
MHNHFLDLTDDLIDLIFSFLEERRFEVQFHTIRSFVYPPNRIHFYIRFISIFQSAERPEATVYSVCKASTFLSLSSLTLLDLHSMFTRSVVDVRKEMDLASSYPPVFDSKLEDAHGNSVLTPSLNPPLGVLMPDAVNGPVDTATKEKRDEYVCKILKRFCTCVLSSVQKFNIVTHTCFTTTPRNFNTMSMRLLDSYEFGFTTKFMTNPSASCKRFHSICSRKRVESVEINSKASPCCHRDH